MRTIRRWRSALLPATAFISLWSQTAFARVVQQGSYNNRGVGGLICLVCGCGLFWALVIALIVYLIVRGRRSSQQTPPPGYGSAPVPPMAPPVPPAGTPVPPTAPPVPPAAPPVPPAEGEPRPPE